ncbi:LysR family transcriptional regulator [Ligilactobacillus cholophilus]|uniref:LysR family transcriptional regulator n=1 Tax=Ligilactobacillus cholophilus TaxID=3050131 RepID=UPI0025B27A5C|nr:LysR family transcriptional regulator [Ligilactobacillus cholophilus]
MKNTKGSFLPSKALDYFLQLTETMNYTQAAQILGISQPALTQQIKKLEHSVGAPLFYNVGKKLHLSDAGYTLLDATHQIYETVSSATDQIQRSTEMNQGSIDIGVLSSIENDVFTDFAVKYYQKHSEVNISFHVLTRKELWQKLEDNRIDLGIMYLPDSSIKNWKPYESKKIISDELKYLHHNDNLKKSVKISLKKTLKDDWVTYPKDYYLSNIINEFYKKQMIDSPNEVAHFTKSDSIYRFASEVGVSTALPASYVQANNNGIKKMHTASFDPKIQFELSFVYRKGKEKIPRIENLLNEFDNYLAKKDYVSRLTELSEKA